MNNIQNDVQARCYLGVLNSIFLLSFTFLKCFSDVSRDLYQLEFLRIEYTFSLEDRKGERTHVDLVILLELKEACSI